jgi:hypothetical protein
MASNQKKISQEQNIPFMRTVPCMTSKKTFWNALVTGLCGWCSVRAWDDIICDGTIKKEVQANHIERNYHMNLLLLAPPIDVYSRLLEHHDPHKAYGPGVKHRGAMEYRKRIINQVAPSGNVDLEATSMSMLAM